jgi:hypothetical protein
VGRDSRELLSPRLPVIRQPYWFTRHPAVLNRGEADSVHPYPDDHETNLTTSTEATTRSKDHHAIAVKRLDLSQ